MNDAPVILDAGTASVLERLAAAGITALRRESAGGWRPDDRVAAALQVLRDAQTRQARRDAIAPISDIGSVLASGPAVLALCLTSAEAADLLVVGERRVHQLASSGELVARQTAGGGWLIFRPSVVARRLDRTSGRPAHDVERLDTTHADPDKDTSAA